ncbi:MAG TPA: exonuclease sbcCD subunit D [Clostridiales bacterium]|nr:exonuclease sbcCD subunit D [Clostridiales bacterium]
MRILHTSDWHLGRSLEQVSRLPEQREFIRCLCRIAEEQEADLVLVAGDVFDTCNPSAAAEELFYEALEGLGSRGRRGVVVIAGNHDNPDRLCAASPLARRNGIVLLGYPGSDPGQSGFEAEFADSTVRILQSGAGWLEIQVAGCPHPAVILTLPYPSESRLEEVLTREAEEGRLQKAYSEKIGEIFAELSEKFREDTVNLVVGHLFLRGGRESESERTLQVGGALTVDPGRLPVKAHFAALGHLHRPQAVSGAACPAVYSGSPLAYSFSEAEHTKAVYRIDAEPGLPAEITPLYLDCGRPLRRWVAEQGVEQALKWCRDGRDANAWVDLEIVTDRVLTAEEQRSLRALHSGIIQVRPRIRGDSGEAALPESREGRKIDELFREYYRFRMGGEIPEELMQAFVEILSEEEEDAGDETETA